MASVTLLHMPDDALLTTAEVCDLFRVTRQTLLRWRKNGTIAPIRVGGTIRYRRDEVDALLATTGPETAA